MVHKSCKPDSADLAEYKQHATGQHHHRGKSSESLLDKEAILSALKIGHGQTVLDAGCGNGYMSKEFSRLVGVNGKVYALDPDKISIAALRKETEGTNIVALVGDITTRMPLPASAFNLIYLSTVVHGFVGEQIEGFKVEVKRLLAPDGKLAVVEIVKRDTPFGPPHNIRFSPEELRNALGFASKATVELGEYFYLQIFENR
ncbi:class I SAM-dependent methyltransferase [bacterium]|nr:class I SAM-dependent methyltransferase [bacterium]